MPIISMGESVLSGTQEAFQTAITSVQSDFLGFMGIALPVGLAIGGAIIAIRLGWKFFKGVAK